MASFLLLPVSPLSVPVLLLSAGALAVALPVAAALRGVLPETEPLLVAREGGGEKEKEKDGEKEKADKNRKTKTKKNKKTERERKRERRFFPLTLPLTYHKANHGTMTSMVHPFCNTFTEALQLECFGGVSLQSSSVPGVAHGRRAVLPLPLPLMGPFPGSLPLLLPLLFPTRVEVPLLGVVHHERPRRSRTPWHGWRVCTCVCVCVCKNRLQNVIHKALCGGRNRAKPGFPLHAKLTCALAPKRLGTTTTQQGPTLRKGVRRDGASVVAACVAATQNNRHGHTLDPTLYISQEAIGRSLVVALCPVGGVCGRAAKSVPVHSGHEGGRGTTRWVLESRGRYCDGHPWKRKREKAREREQERKINRLNKDCYK